MKKKIFYVIVLLVYSNLFSQVGIGTTNPQSSLDVRSTNQAMPSNTDGLLIPKVDQFPLTNPAAQQQGMLVYLTTTTGSDVPGFYYWNNPTTTWLPFGGSTDTYWDRNASGYLFPETTTDRVEIFTNTDASGTAGTGSLEIANSLRIDGNEVITNTGTELFLQNGNNGNLSIDNTTLFVESNLNNVGIGTFSPDARLEIYNTTASEQSLLVHKTSGSSEAVRIQNTGTGIGLYSYNNTSNNGTSLYNYGTGRSLYVSKSTGSNDAARIQNYGSGTGLYVYNNSVSNGTSLYNHGTGRGLYIYKASGNGEGAYINNFANGSGLNVRSNSIAANGISASSGGFYCDLAWATQTGGTSWGITTGASGVNGASDRIGVEGRANWSNSSTTDKMGGLFYVTGTNGGTSGWNSPALAAVGSIVDNTVYKIVGYGIVSTLVRDTEENDRVMVAPEAPEALFQDYGIGQLINGKAHISLDPILTKNISVDETHPLKVFIQLEGNCNGVYVTNKSDTGFDIIELNNGQSNVSFSYQLVANRANEDRGGQISNYADMRFKPLSKKIVEKEVVESIIEEEIQLEKEQEPKLKIKKEEERKE